MECRENIVVCVVIVCCSRMEGVSVHESGNATGQLFKNWMASL